MSWSPQHPQPFSPFSVGARLALLPLFLQQYMLSCLKDGRRLCIVDSYYVIVGPKHRLARHSIVFSSHEVEYHPYPCRPFCCHCHDHGRDPRKRGLEEKAEEKCGLLDLALASPQTHSLGVKQVGKTVKKVAGPIVGFAFDKVKCGT